MKEYGLDSNWLRLWLHNGNTMPPTMPGSDASRYRRKRICLLLFAVLMTSHSTLTDLSHALQSFVVS